MIKKRLLLIITLLFSVFYSNSQTVEDRVKKQIEKDYNSIKVKLSGDLLTQLNQIAYEATPVISEDFKAILPFNEIHESIFRIQGLYWAESEFEPLTIWEKGKWEMLSHIEDPEIEDVILETNMIVGEYRSTSFCISNATGNEQDIKIKLTGLATNSNPSYITVHEVLWTGVKLDEGTIGEPVAAALPHVNLTGEYYHISIPAGITKQIWLTIHPVQIDYGNSIIEDTKHIYNGNIQVNCSELNINKQVSLELAIYPFYLPTEKSLQTGGFSYTETNKPEDEKNGITIENYSTVVNQLQSHFINAPWGSRKTFDLPWYSRLTGEFASPPRTNFADTFFASWDGVQNYYLYQHTSVYPIDRGYFSTNSIEYKRAVKVWSDYWTNYITDREIEPDKVYLNLIDEPKPNDPNREKELVHNMNTLNEAGNKMKFWVNPIIEVLSVADDINPDIIALSDVLAPKRWLFHANKNYREYFLEKVNENNFDSKIFTWDGSSNGISEVWDVKNEYKSSRIRRDSAKYFVGDFNKDGKSDLLSFDQYPSGDTYMKVWYGTNDGLSDVWETRGKYSASDFTRDNADYYTGDFNGDGSTDLLGFYIEDNFDSKMLVWDGGDEGLSKDYETRAEFEAANYSRDRAEYYVGDFNGDGYDDLLGFYQYPSYASKMFVWKGSSAGLSKYYDVRAELAASSYSRDRANYYVGDFDGNGSDDLLGFYQYPSYASKIFVWKGKSTGLSKYYDVRAELAASSYSRDRANYYVGDFDGNGSDDLMGFYQYPSFASKMFVWEGSSAGLSKYYDVRAQLAAGSYSRDRANYYVDDFDGNGCDDLLGFYQYPSFASKMFVWEGESAGLSKYYDVRGEYSSANYSRDRGIYLKGNFNGDTSTDLLSFYQYPNGSRELQVYACMTNSKHIDPYNYYRMQPWLCWEYGMTGSHFWALTNNGGKSSWNEYAIEDSSTVPTTPFFIDENTITSGKHMEALREGIEDYEYFVLLKNAIQIGIEDNINSEVTNQANLTLAKISEVYHSSVDSTNLLWKNNIDRTEADILLKEILNRILDIQNELGYELTTNSLSNDEYKNTPNANSIENRDLLLKNTAINIYPNPSSGKITIQKPDNDASYQLRIFNLLGNLVYFKDNINTDAFSLELQNNTNSVYLVQIIMDNEIINKRIIMIK